MRIKLLLTLSLITINCFSAELGNIKDPFWILYPIVFKDSSEAEIGGLIFDVVILNKVFENAKWDFYETKMKKYLKILETSKDPNLRRKITNKSLNILVIWAIHTINMQNKIEFFPNRFFLSLFKAIIDAKEKKNSYSKLITGIADLEVLFRLMNLKLSSKDTYNLTHDELKYVFEKDPNNKDPYYQDNLINECIRKCKNHKLPGLHFLNCMISEKRALWLICKNRGLDV